ncbi:MAG: hypothetical protein PHV32_16850 [Eubacteriales bacterium]|nr:hypothetical protein [Eubacteriales bacterium]
MNTINMNKDPAYCFAALKLIEQLYRDGIIPGFMFRNILSDYADIVDESLFIKGNHNHKEKIA